MLEQITDDTFEEEILQAGGLVMVDFWASWCPPCKMMEPIIERLAVEFEGRVRVVGLNIDRNPHTASRYEVQGVPTFILFLAGEPRERLTAAQTENKLRSILENALG